MGISKPIHDDEDMQEPDCGVACSICGSIYDDEDMHQLDDGDDICPHCDEK